MLINYQALRSIKSGHSASTSYNITVDVIKNDETPYWAGVDIRTLDGTAFRETYNIGDDVSVATVWLKDGDTYDRYDIKEFLDSVRFGETFTIDGVDCELTALKKPYSRSFRMPDYYSFSFVYRVI